TPRAPGRPSRAGTAAPRPFSPARRPTATTPHRSPGSRAPAPPPWHGTLVNVGPPAYTDGVLVEEAADDLQQVVGPLDVQAVARPRPRHQLVAGAGGGVRRRPGLRPAP